ncbi:MAG: hypothetical protein A2V88_11285 [Elusimicrobia bacterium RBG_16_66_12]|nr:MAG: hypothetical protein A2V88_11285 [Elusimicrobia bacterium RBG_16_66_12]
MKRLLTRNWNRAFLDSPGPRSPRDSGASAKVKMLGSAAVSLAATPLAGPAPELRIVSATLATSPALTAVPARSTPATSSLGGTKARASNSMTCGWASKPLPSLTSIVTRILPLARASDASIGMSLVTVCPGRSVPASTERGRIRPGAGEWLSTTRRA